MEKSYFDGGLLQLIGWRLLGALVTLCTFGICYPWAVCMEYNWEIKIIVCLTRIKAWYILSK